MATAEVIEVGSIIHERYQILQAIGSGATAVVYLVWDSRLMKQWALKAVDVTALNHDGFDARQEARTLLALEHPSLPKVVDVFRWMQYEMIIRDFVPGENLEEYVANHGPFSLEKLKVPLVQLAEVLNYLHSLPIPLIYRDLKPANVMVKPDGQIALVDFGIARRFNPLHHADTVPLGTKGYCAPEQYCSSQTEPRSDVYGLGAIIYYALTGEHFFAIPQEEVWDAFDTESMQSAKLVIQKSMALSIEGRFDNALAVVQSLYGASESGVAPKREVETRKVKQVLGVLGLQRGVGTSHIAWSLAQGLAVTGYRVILATQNDGTSFNMWWQYIDGAQYEEVGNCVDTQRSARSFKYRGVTIHQRMSSNTYLEVLDKNFDYLVMDYGAGQDKLSEFLRCHRKWVICPATPWSIEPNNKIVSSCKGFEDLQYLVNLTDEKGAGLIADWLGIKRPQVTFFPYCNRQGDAKAHFKVLGFAPLADKAKRASISKLFTRKRGVD